MGLKIDRFLYPDTYDTLGEDLKGLTIPEIIKTLQEQLKVANNSVKFLSDSRKDLNRELYDTKGHLRRCVLLNSNQEVELKTLKIKLKNLEDSKTIRELQEETDMEVFKAPEKDLGTLEELLIENQTKSQELLMEALKGFISSQKEADKERDLKLYEYLKNNVTYGIQKIGKGLKEKRIL